MRMVTVRGVGIPALGLGTWSLNGDVARRMVGHALEVGYRHIDTAQMYGNEAEVGEAIERSPVPRADIWLTTKIWPDNFRANDLKRAAEQSIRTLRTEPDLLLLHWPSPSIPLAETIGALNEVKRRGHTRHIGISNFTVALIKEAVGHSEEPLIVNQVEYHPFLSQEAVLGEVRAQGMALTAYSPLAKGKVVRDGTLQRIGERHGKAASQVALRWLIQQDGVAAIPRSSREKGVRSNFEIFDFELSEAEMTEIFTLTRAGDRQVSVAGVAPRWD
jgi:2,5-diketo-D-gluconate reductase B